MSPAGESGLSQERSSMELQDKSQCVNVYIISLPAPLSRTLELCQSLSTLLRPPSLTTLSWHLQPKVRKRLPKCRDKLPAATRLTPVLPAATKTMKTAACHERTHEWGRCSGCANALVSWGGLFRNNPDLENGHFPTRFKATHVGSDGMMDTEDTQAEDQSGRNARNTEQHQSGSCL